MTDLNGDHPSNANSSVVSPEFNFAGLTEDPVISLALSWRFDWWNDGFKMEMDLGDGSGFQPVGDEDWYNAGVNHANASLGHARSSTAR